MKHEDLLKYAHYDPDTGVFTRLKSAGNRASGTTIGSRSLKGYLTAMVMAEYVKVHRLAWFYMTGAWPTKEIDHINGVKDDNRFANLRDVSTSENCLNQHGPRRNNRSGFQGVSRIKKTGRFRARCTCGGVEHHLGVFATAEEAHEAYIKFKQGVTNAS